MNGPSPARVAARHRVAASAIDLDPNKVYYHGTPSERAGESILRSGIEVPDLTTRRQDAFQPVRGKVYLTTHVRYGMLYALGGEIAALFFQGRVLPAYPPRMWGGSEWGYLFEVPGSSLGEIHPDEDSVGGMLADGTAPRWLTDMAQRLLKGLHPEVRPNQPDTLYVPDFMEPGEWEEVRRGSLYDLALDDGFFSLKAQSVVGKILLEAMTPQQELELISMGSHVAHAGRVAPTGCWKIHKGKAHLLEIDGSNFFRVAERCR